MTARHTLSLSLSLSLSHTDFLGTTKLLLKDLFGGGDSPWVKRLLLEDVAKGEIELKIDLELKASDLLL